MLGCSACGAVLPKPLKSVPAAPGVRTEYIPVWVDARFSDKEKGDIRAALDSWDTVMNGYAQFVVVEPEVSNPAEDDHVNERRALTAEGLVINQAEMTPEEILSSHLAWYSSDDDVIRVLSERVGYRDLATIVRHEIGHFLMSPAIQADKEPAHIWIAGSLMWPYYGPDQSTCVDQVTAMFVAQARDWD